MKQQTNAVLVGVAGRVMRKSDPKRVARAIDALAEGRWQIEIGSLKSGVAKGYVIDGEKRWAVRVTARSAQCSCPDCFYAGFICKHVVGFAMQLETVLAKRKF